MNKTADDHLAKPALLIYYHPKDARTPRAGWFDLGIKATAALAAERHSYVTREITATQVDLVKAAVVQGQVSPAGRLTLGAVKRDVFSRLIANLDGEAPVAAEDGRGMLPPGVMPTYVGLSDMVPPHEVPLDPLWAALAVNMVVLAAEADDRGAPDGWWEAVIVAIHGDVLTLRFRDYPHQPLIRRRRDEVAIPYPPPVRV